MKPGAAPKVVCAGCDKLLVQPTLRRPTDTRNAAASVALAPWWAYVATREGRPLVCSLACLAKVVDRTPATGDAASVMRRAAALRTTGARSLRLSALVREVLYRGQIEVLVVERGNRLDTPAEPLNYWTYTLLRNLRVDQKLVQTLLAATNEVRARFKPPSTFQFQCKYCGSLFAPQRRWAKFCSRQCRNRARPSKKRK